MLHAEPLGIPGEPSFPALVGGLTASPNPFASTSTVTFELARLTQIQLRVFDASGHLIWALADGNLEEGFHSVIFDGSTLPSGVYLLRLQAEGSSATVRIVLIR